MSWEDDQQSSECHFKLLFERIEVMLKSHRLKAKQILLISWIQIFRRNNSNKIIECSNSLLLQFAPFLGKHNNNIQLTEQLLIHKLGKLRYNNDNNKFIGFPFLYRVSMRRSLKK